MKRILLSMLVAALLKDAISWISQPDTFNRRSSLAFQSPMAPMDFIDVEITGHAKGSNSSSKRETNIKEEDKSRTKEILMPSISPTMTKGKIVEWLVRTGDTIRKGDPIMVIESEKEVQGARGYRMNQDVNANVDGVLAAIYQQPGQAVEVGAVLGIIVPDFIIDAEIEGQSQSKPSDDEKEEEKGSAEEPVATTTMNSADGTTEAAAAEATSSANSKVPAPPTLMDEMMPSTTEINSVSVSGASSTTESVSSNPDWVHGHHATTDGMVNDNSFYNAHTTQASSSGATSKGRFDNSFTGSIDSTDPFYSPYQEGIGPGSRPQPFPSQPQPSMKPNGAGDNFYEAYQDKRPDDPYVQQMQQWQQHSNGNIANANMGDYYKAERNGQSVSSSSPYDPPPPQANGYNVGSNYASGVSSEPQDVFVKGVVSSPTDTQSSVYTDLYSPTTTTTSTTTTTTTSTDTTKPIVDTTTTPSPTTASTSVPAQEAATTAAPTTTPAATTTSPSPVTTSAPATPTVEPQTVVTPPTIDMSKVNAMESRIANLEESLRTSGQESTSFSTTVRAELDSLKQELDQLKKDYDDNVKQLEDSYQTSLSQVGSDFTKSMEELRDWDTLTVTWDIKDFEKSLQNDLTTYTSEEFTVAGYSMTLEMQIFGTNDEGTRDVGFYIMHTGGLNYVPIMIGGSKIIIQSTTGNDDAVKVFVDDASIEDSHYGWGWKKFFSLQDLKQSFVNSKGEIQVTATVRVKRVRTCRINTAI